MTVAELIRALQTCPISLESAEVCCSCKQGLVASVARRLTLTVNAAGAPILVIR